MRNITNITAGAGYQLWCWSNVPSKKELSYLFMPCSGRQQHPLGHHGDFPLTASWLVYERSRSRIAWCICLPNDFWKVSVLWLFYNTHYLVSNNRESKKRSTSNVRQDAGGFSSCTVNNLKYHENQRHMGSFPDYRCYHFAHNLHDESELVTNYARMFFRI